MNAQLPVQPGDIVAGKYRVDRVLGIGGMGVVMAATHLDLLEPRALKFMLPSAMPDAEAVERFLREARAASRLKSEHVARVHDVGKLPDGPPYIVMEYLEGADLGATLRAGGAVPIDQAVLYVLQALDALAEAHAAGIVHRDLKPANLFLARRADGSPSVKVLDFGISKLTGEGADEGDVTKTHAVLGSPNYMSPEQMRSTRTVDARTDIWSLGVILYQLVTGRQPFRGRSITEIVAAVITSTPQAPSELAPGLPPALERVILRCLQRDLARRYPDVGELARELLPFAPAGAGFTVDRILRVLSGAPGIEPPSGASQRSSLPLAAPAAVATGAWGSTTQGAGFGAPRRSLVTLAVALAAATMLGAFVAWSFASYGRPAPPALAGSAGPTAPPLARPAEGGGPSGEPTASAAPAATGDASAQPAASAPADASARAAGPAPSASAPRPRKAPADPFGMDRK